MSVKIFFQQLRRNSNRTWLNILLLAAAVAFFVMSLNLHQNSVRNIQEAEDAYSTIAIMEIYGDIDKYGNLVEPYSKEHVGYKSVAVNGFDFSEVVNSSGVIDWDLRAKYAAYIEDHVALQEKDYTMADRDVFRFKVAGGEPIELPIRWDVSEKYPEFHIELEVTEAAGCFLYDTTFFFDGIDAYAPGEKEAYADQIRQLNRSDEINKVILYPGVEYITSTWTSSGWAHSAVDPTKFVYNGHRKGARLYPNYMVKMSVWYLKRRQIYYL